MADIFVEFVDPRLDKLIPEEFDEKVLKRTDEKSCWLVLLRIKAVLEEFLGFVWVLVVVGLSLDKFRLVIICFVVFVRE